MEMTRDDVIRLATEAGFFPDWALGNLVTNFERFAELVTAAEREACAALKEDALAIFNGPETCQGVRDAIEWYANAISARGIK